MARSDPGLVVAGVQLVADAVQKLLELQILKRPFHLQLIDDILIAFCAGDPGQNVRRDSVAGQTMGARTRSHAGREARP